ncbi:Ras GTPase-activating-like protein IQGAP2/3 [Nematocida minor]|uniref:Ras GTPase-activating-like protein IQGAP2/3 n=1 Tax=Nematocida minor TaxID=1912983 RepID=UPI00221F1F5B|nr:Ras GTPase-activating-like protein IQGAP2/3 [Nematocida minor]KAI5190686.1 Ras GTPase-activating-like protein IQGAP2/3 [Nematocida minor]
MQEGVYYSTIEEDRMLTAEELDKERKRNRVYEYLCRLQEAREWMEKIIQEKIPDEFENALKDGVYLARLVQLFSPELVSKVFVDPVLQYRHTDNINKFFEFAKSIGLPVVFLFDLVDLYEGKNIPKVIYCIHALGHYLSKKNIAIKLGNLVGRAIFTEDQISKKEKEIEESGVNLPSFSNISGAIERTTGGKSKIGDMSNKDASEYGETAQSPMEISLSINEDALTDGEMNTSMSSNIHDILTDDISDAAAEAVQVVQAYMRSLLGLKVIKELQEAGHKEVSIFSLRRILFMLSGVEEKEEAVVDEFNKILVQLFTENAELEKKVSAVENRISLLIRNKMQSGKNSSNTKQRQKGSYMKYKSLQKLFAKVQDDPSILSQVIVSMRQREAESFCTNKILGLFGGAKTPREEYAYLRVVEALVHAQTPDNTANSFISGNSNTAKSGNQTAKSGNITSNNNNNRTLGGLALRSFLIAQGMTDIQLRIRQMISQENKSAREIVAYIIDEAGNMPHALRFYARFLVMALNGQHKERESHKETVATELFLAMWEILFMPIIVSPETFGIKSDLSCNRAHLIEVCHQVAQIVRTEEIRKDSNENSSSSESIDILRILRVASSESISEYYTMKYIATRPINNMLCLSGEEVNYLLGTLLSSSASPEAVRKMAEECHPFPFKLVFLVPGGISPYIQENAGIIEKRLCKWSIIRLLSHTTGKNIHDALQNKSYEFGRGAYALDSAKSIEQCKDRIRKYSARLFDLGIVKNTADCSEILTMAAQDMLNRVRSSQARKREIKATEKAINSLEKAREVIEARQIECQEYLAEIGSKIMENGKEFKYPAKSLLLDGVVLRMYNWQPSQLDSIDIAIKRGAYGKIVVTVLLIGIQSASEVLPFDELLLRESEGESEMVLETVGAVFSIPKLICLINKKFHI